MLEIHVDITDKAVALGFVTLLSCRAGFSNVRKLSTPPDSGSDAQLVVVDNWSKLPAEPQTDTIYLLVFPANVIPFRGIDSQEMRLSHDVYTCCIGDGVGFDEAFLAATFCLEL